MSDSNPFFDLELPAATVLRCPICNISPPIFYEPGVTFMACKCASLALPDWQPIELAQKWNAQIKFR